MTEETPPTLNPAALGIALGILWGACVALLAVVSLNGWGEEVRELVQELYIGYDETNSGAVIGAGWGFVDGLVGGVVCGWLYNVLDWRT